LLKTLGAETAGNKRLKRSDGSFSLTVQLLDSTEMPFEVTPITTVGELKASIETTLGVPVLRQQLVHLEHAENHQILVDCEVHAHSAPLVCLVLPAKDEHTVEFVNQWLVNESELSEAQLLAVGTKRPITKAKLRQHFLERKSYFVVKNSPDEAGPPFKFVDDLRFQDNLEQFPEEFKKIFSDAVCNVNVDTALEIMALVCPSTLERPTILKVRDRNEYNHQCWKHMSIIPIAPTIDQKMHIIPVFLKLAEKQKWAVDDVGRMLMACCAAWGGENHYDYSVCWCDQANEEAGQKEKLKVSERRLAIVLEFTPKLRDTIAQWGGYAASFSPTFSEEQITSSILRWAFVHVNRNSERDITDHAFFPKCVDVEYSDY
jgi:hypothetical protein